MDKRSKKESQKKPKTGIEGLTPQQMESILAQVGRCLAEPQPGDRIRELLMWAKEVEAMV